MVESIIERQPGRVHVIVHGSRATVRPVADELLGVLPLEPVSIMRGGSTETHVYVISVDALRSAVTSLD